MKELNKETACKPVRPERIIQFGEGNFLRAFADWMIQKMNAVTDFNGSVVVVQPIEKGMADELNKQDCLYHVNLQADRRACFFLPRQAHPVTLSSL